MSTPLTDEERDRSALLGYLRAAYTTGLLFVNDRPAALEMIAAHESRVRLAERERIIGLMEEEADAQTAVKVETPTYMQLRRRELHWKAQSLRQFVAKLRSEP